MNRVVFSFCAQFLFINQVFADSAVLSPSVRIPVLNNPVPITEPLRLPTDPKIYSPQESPMFREPFGTTPRVTPNPTPGIPPEWVTAFGYAAAVLYGVWGVSQLPKYYISKDECPLTNTTDGQKTEWFNARRMCKPHSRGFADSTIEFTSSEEREQRFQEWITDQQLLSTQTINRPTYARRNVIQNLGASGGGAPKSLLGYSSRSNEKENIIESLLIASQDAKQVEDERLRILGIPQSVFSEVWNGLGEFQRAQIKFKTKIKNLTPLLTDSEKAEVENLKNRIDRAQITAVSLYAFGDLEGFILSLKQSIISIRGMEIGLERTVVQRAEAVGNQDLLLAAIDSLSNFMNVGYLSLSLRGADFLLSNNPYSHSPQQAVEEGIEVGRKYGLLESTEISTELDDYILDPTLVDPIMIRHFVVGFLQDFDRLNPKKIIISLRVNPGAGQMWIEFAYKNGKQENPSLLSAGVRHTFQASPDISMAQETREIDGTTFNILSVGIPFTNLAPSYLSPVTNQFPESFRIASRAAVLYSGIQPGQYLLTMQLGREAFDFLQYLDFLLSDDGLLPATKTTIETMRDTLNRHFEIFNQAAIRGDYASAVVEMTHLPEHLRGDWDEHKKTLAVILRGLDGEALMRATKPYSPIEYKLKNLETISNRIIGGER